MMERNKECFENTQEDYLGSMESGKIYWGVMGTIGMLKF